MNYMCSVSEEQACHVDLDHTLKDALCLTDQVHVPHSLNISLCPGGKKANETAFLFQKAHSFLLERKIIMYISV